MNKEDAYKIVKKSKQVKAWVEIGEDNYSYLLLNKSEFLRNIQCSVDSHKFNITYDEISKIAYVN